MGGKNKLLLKVDGESLVQRTVKELNQGPVAGVTVVTGRDSDLVMKELAGLKTTITHNSDFLSGMHSSIKIGLKAMNPTSDAFFICLSDQPYFSRTTLQKLIDGYQNDSIVVPSFEGKRGHPVLISGSFRNEILQEPDGDYGCAYLLKRYPEKVITVPVDDHGILIDVDKPEDYARILETSYASTDPVSEFYELVSQLRGKGETFAIASVIEVIGSASAKNGSKAIFSSEGKNLLGWVGGGCAERFIGEESKLAMTEGKTRVVLADLDDEIFGLGVACGGKMRVFIDPIVPNESITLPHSEKFQNEIRSLSGFYGWNVKKENSKSPESVEELLLLMSKAVAIKRGRKLEPMKVMKKVPATFVPFRIGDEKSVTIVGRTRITEALARHFTLLNFSVRAIGPDVNQSDYPSTVKCTCLDDGYSDITFSQGELVVIASHTSQDPEIVKNALKAGASYVGMIGSYKRSEEVLTHLGLMNRTVEVPLSIPAGLDIAARNPDEIALSVVAEVLTLKGFHA